jgi:hypothetical protein
LVIKATEKLENGRKVRILNIMDEFTRECLATESGFHLTGHDVIEVLRYLFAVRGCPTYIRSDNGPECSLLLSEMADKPYQDSGRHRQRFTRVKRNTASCRPRKFRQFWARDEQGCVDIFA